MRRIEVVLRELERLTQTISRDDLALGTSAFTAEQIGFNLGLARNSVSKDLNQLWSDGLVIKTRGRPVFFLHRQATQALLDRPLTESEREIGAISDLLPDRDLPPVSDPFTLLIGHDRSLRDAVEKGKAAVLYPHGLHVLLTGPSGVGKTFFAELMHRYACEHTDDSPPPLVYFNCAEYANNPELLSSHLFGHRQGAFTGATESKTGLIEQADGGYLLLDEVHRLPYEGQEKLFSLLDKGEYRPLGASGPARSITVRLICATTEPVSSSLLRTFQRRIQVAIDLPGIRQRSLEEQLELIIGFLQRESRKIERSVSIDKTLLLWLLNKPLEGNIGQLKSDIQFLCAQAWASGMAAQHDVLLLDGKLADGATNPTQEQRMLVDALFNGKPLLSIDARTLPQLKSPPGGDGGIEESDLFYSFLTREYVNLRNSNVPPAETLAILKNKLSSIFEYGLYIRDSGTRSPRYGDQIEERVALLISYVEQILGFSLPENLVNPLRKHLLALIGYVQRGLIPQLYSSSLILDRCKDEYENATQLCRKINDLLNIQCPATEVVWLCLFLKECRHYRQRISASPDCGVILIAHGATTATSMAQYVNRVLERELFCAIDMPFEQSVHDTLDALIRLMQARRWQRLILIVDIGSLVHFGSTISKLFQIDVLLMPDITLTSLLEIGLDLSYETSDLPRLAALMQEKGIPSQLCTPQQENVGKVLVISCITGMGTAEKIKTVLEESFGELMSQDTRMVILDYNEVRSPERVQQAISAHERLAGIVGTFQPGLPDIPFISLEELFSEQGPELVLSLLTPDLSSAERRLEMERSASRFISALTMESIINHISVLNPQRILKEMEGVLSQLRATLAIAPSRQVTLRFLIHCCCMVERIVINRKPLQMALEMKPDMDTHAFSVIKSAFHPVEEAYAIRLSDAEYIYIYELLYS
ncbi:transcriptional regulator DagR [Raoultella planticola]|uniref:Transcriptional regulatory protein zraR n=1 Tax=Raoultella planticola TaxID=575 RepID=A0A8G2EAC2_RAOPL|nr:transcriptional regulator DagR [Raoultella planticola]EJR0224815.1 transcriptional regulator DagR [Raoultella planticola]EJR0225688.1 transcriptional regulator DagR [Raoultella planticola]EJR0354634.1 transcriptional regulator DagR [Raoultella planticola]EJR0355691.1 transcriptional regulator DagR [Raoultella planticola]MDV1450398.1 transcriptional regulator DagR [Raoultella planticola]